MLVAVGSAKGTVGVTTLATALAAMWPRPGAVLVEADPSGGDLWARWGLHPEPGLSGLAAAAGWDGPIPAIYRQPVPVGVDAVLAIPGDQAAASVRTLADKGVDALRRAAATQTVILDLGRLERDSPGLVLAAAADHLLLPVAPSLGARTQLGARMPWLAAAVRGRMWLVRRSRTLPGKRQLAVELGCPVAGTVPHSRWVAGALSGQLRVPNWRRLPMARAAHRIGVVLCALEPAAPVPPAPRPDQIGTLPAPPPSVGRKRARTRRP